MADDAAAAAAARKQTKLIWEENYWHPNKHRSDRHAIYAGQYHASDQMGTQDITSIDPMFYTDDHRSSFGRDALQFYSIKIASIRGGLRWPLDVFGMVVARDALDNRTRNFVFARARSNCQTITEEHPYLELTGPSRAVVTCADLGNIEIVLKAKGASESEDRDLSFLALPLGRGYCSYDTDDYTSKRSRLELTFRQVARSVEATISARLVGGSSWPEGFQGVLAASIASIDDAELVLLAFEGNRLPVVADDGMVELSRRVVSVEPRDGELKVSVVARRLGKDGDVARRDDIVFRPKNAGRSCGVLDLVGSCKLQVNVAWSLF